MLFYFLDLCMSLSATPPAGQILDSVSKFEVWFPPKDNPVERLVSFADAAKKSIYVQCYQLTSQPIADALIRAAKRGVKVTILADKTQTGGYSCVIGMVKMAKEDPQLGACMTFFIDGKPPIAHNKVFIFDVESDDAVVVGGSFNYSKNAVKNAENMTACRDKKLALIYLKNIFERKSKSQTYEEYLTARSKKDIKGAIKSAEGCK